MKKPQIDAYRYFFPAGWLLGIWGVVLWILFPWNLVSYPGIRHPEIMMGGFFLCFVCGFLMTAAPRFTSTHGPTSAEQRTAGALILALFVSLFPQSRLWFFLSVDATFLFLIYFMLRRFLVRASNPPDAFIFVGFGLIGGLFGAIVLTLTEFIDVPSSLYLLGRLFFMQAYILSLVLGVGSRLIPALLGGAHPADTKGSPKILKFVFLGVAFNSSYLVEVYGSSFFANILRSVTIAYMMLVMWKIYRYPARKAVQTFWLWSSAWMLLLAQVALVFVPSFRIHLLHVIFVSGLALMTFMIAVRVTLSHGKHEMVLEKKSKALAVAGFLIIFAGFTRLSAGFAPAIYQSHLVYAAYTWIIGLAIWGWIFIPKMVRVNQ